MTGPEQVRAKLTEIWKLTDDEAAAIFRDERALCHAFLVHGDLEALFCDRDTEARWLREPRGEFEGRTPIEMMVGGAGEVVALTLAWNAGRL